MMSVLLLLMLVILAKIVFIDSPVGQALGDAIRNLVSPRAPQGRITHTELDNLRRDVEELRERVDRVVEEQAFLTRVLSSSRRLSLGPGEIEASDN